VIVDTNVVAYAFVGPEEHHAEARRLLSLDGELLAPDALRNEYLSVVWQWSRQASVEPRLAQEVFDDGLAAIDRYVPAANLERLALDLALQRDQSPYDTLFVALAVELEDVVATYDRALLERFPDWCAAPAAILA